MRAFLRPALAVAVCAPLLAFSACGEERPPLAGELPLQQEEDDPFLQIDDPTAPGEDASGLCGNLIVPIEVDRPNLYFVLDASGSMTDSMSTPDPNTGWLPTRYQAARGAIANVLQAVGHRVRYGAALFPDEPFSDATCPTGSEVFETTAGDDVSYAVAGEQGPVLKSLLFTLGKRAPEGLTPTSSALAALTPALQDLDGETYVFLLTDGAPNCNVLPCDAEQCTPNIEGFCPEDTNCCDPLSGYLDSRWCLDADPTIRVVESLNEAGIKTFIIGMPGTDLYATLLDDLAVAGGTARDARPFYYPVESAADLADTLKQLGTEVAVECTLHLEETPPDPALVNVYFDGVVVHRDEDDGWRLASETSVELLGESCRQLKGGDVLQVQVAAGCPSIVR